MPYAKSKCSNKPAKNISTNNSSSLKDWIREQYHIICFGGSGQFIGKRAFDNRLVQAGVIRLAGATKARIGGNWSRKPPFWTDYLYILCNDKECIL